MSGSAHKAAGSPPGAARILLAFVLALPAGMLLAAIAAPWVQAALAPMAVFPLHRVFTRLTMLAVILIMAWLIRRHGLADARTLGFTGPWPAFLRRILAGLGAGLIVMLAAVLPLLLLDLRMLDARAPHDIAGWAQLAAKGLASGLAVALVEETFFRGAMQGALQRAGAVRMAIFLVPVYYAAVHFLGRAGQVPWEEVNALSGFVALAGFFDGLADPVHVADAFLALWLVGVLLALVRHHTGNIAGCIGLHAGFVTVISVVRRTSSPDGSSELAFLTSSFDGLLGLWIAALAALACAAAWRRLS